MNVSRYPLYCVDRGDRVDAERQYAGPYTTHEDAFFAVDESTDLVRRCRQLRPSEIGFGRTAANLAEFESVDALIDELDEAATSGNLPDGAHYSIGDRIVSAKHDIDTLPDHRNFDTWVNNHLTLDAYICEGDE